MDSIGNTPPVLLPTQTLSVASPSQGAVLLPAADASSNAAIGAAHQGGADVQAAEQKRYETVQRQAQDIANVFVVSDKTFTIFKDVTGQYITRFTSLRDGRVTYIPEPQLLKMGGGSTAPALNITA